MIKRIFSSILKLSSALILISLFTSASDGSLGPTSTGQAGISLTIPPRISITRIADLNLGAWSGSGDKADEDDVCIYTNNGTGNYQVTASGSGSGGSFELSDGLGNSITYSASWSNSIGSAGSVGLTSGTPLTNQSGACTTSSTCTGCGVNNANFSINIPANTLNSAVPGYYTGSISLVVEPN